MKRTITLLSLVLIYLSLNAQMALGKTYESFIKTNAAKIEFLGPYPGGQMGASMSVGDLNGDGIDDLVVASPFSSVLERQWNGSISLIFSESDWTKNNIDFYGDYSGDQLGTSLTVADFDNDGVQDIAVGAYIAKNHLNESASKAGKVYVIYGKRFLTNQADGGDIGGVDIGDVADLILEGATPGDLFGLSLQSGDVNNDGLADLIVGAPMALQKNVSGLGGVYVYFGSQEGLRQKHNQLFIGQNVAEKFGSTIGVGDLNGNAKNDLVIGAPQAHLEETSQTGKVYIYYDVADATGLVGKPDLTLTGTKERQWFGFSLDVGKLNNDKYYDLIVSSFPFNGEPNDARIDAYYGKSLKYGKIEPIISINNTMDAKLLGSKVLLEDLNKDEIEDIIFGAPGIEGVKSSEAGDLYIIYGDEEGYGKSYSVKDLEINSLIHGEKPDEWFGYGFDVLDFNNDGSKDLAISARYADSPRGVNNGKIYILPGDDKPFGKIKVTIANQGDDQVNRGELVQSIIKNLNLDKEKINYLESCKEHIEFCLFNFMAMSSFDGIELESDLILYPDVPKDHKYYDDINTATMLGLVTGYINEESSPFHPERPVTRVQALKIILGAADLVPAKYQFELISMLGSYANLFNQFSYFKDVDSKLSHMWWYPRYVNFAVENDIIDKGEYFRPDDKITPEELNDMTNRTLDLLN